MKSEKFYDIPGFDGKYQITKTGKIKSHKTWHHKTGHLLTANKLDRGGYVCIHLYRPDGFRKTFKMHRLLGIAFIPNLENKKYINHKNGIKNDNRLKNLEWCTAQENTQHARDNGLLNAPKGVDNSNATFTEVQVMKIFNDRGKHHEIAIRYATNQRLVSLIKNGVTWSHLTGKKYVRKRMTEEVAAKIKSRILNNESVKSIATEFGITRKNVEQIKSGRIWKKV